MKTLEEQRDLIEIQFTLEIYAEKYQSVTTESEKYYIKMKFLDYVIESIQNPRALLNLMKLQEDKFAPFISCLKGVDLDSVVPCKKQRNIAYQEPQEFTIVMCPME